MPNKKTAIPRSLPGDTRISSRTRLTPFAKDGNRIRSGIQIRWAQNLESREEPHPSKNPFPPFRVVGIGASAGGLEAFISLLQFLPPDLGMAYVFLPHLDPNQKSNLTEILSKATSMPVKEVSNRMRAEPNRIYVMPPNACMSIRKGRLKLAPRLKKRGKSMCIDLFLSSLARDFGNRAIGVVLSGNGSDGAHGLEAIKAVGGIAFAQDESSAKNKDMPRNALGTGIVDFVLHPKGIAQELTAISHHPPTEPLEARQLSPQTRKFHKIFAMVRNSTNVDFTHYKDSTIMRRIKRRIALHKLKDLDDYLNYLKKHPPEVKELYQDLLIGVTKFFRDPSTFAHLKNSLFPAIFKHRASSEPIRVWVPGCSTGEEAYSIAILLQEYLESISSNTPFQIFGTDINEVALDKARAGIYGENATSRITKERLQRFFVPVKNGYHVSKTIRETCIFAKQNMVEDPPFSKLDFISCRNVLIYLSPVLHRRALQIFHYALKPTGFLLLGNSETIGLLSDLFSLKDKNHGIYSKTSKLTHPNFKFVANYYKTGKVDLDKRMREEVLGGLDVQKVADRIIMDRYAPAGVLINDNLEILQFRGYTGPYLEPAPGQASLNLLKMAREGLLLDLDSAILQARKRNASVKKDGLEVKYNGLSRPVNIEVIPITTPVTKERHFLILFENAPAPILKSKAPSKDGHSKKHERTKARQILQLQQGLTATREYLQSIIEEQKATNEELLSSNEELQSTNEELETAKEELQSTNEELNTVNEELQIRNLELVQLNSDLSNLFNGVNIPIVMLDNNLHVRRCTALAEKMFHLDLNEKPSILEIQNQLQAPNLKQWIEHVIHKGEVWEQEIEDLQGSWFSIRIRPYRAADGKIDGAVMVLTDIDKLKRGFQNATEAGDYAEAILGTVQTPLLVLDADLRIQTANRAFCQAFRTSKKETEKRLLYEIHKGRWNHSRLKALLREIPLKQTHLENFELVHPSSDGSEILLLNARQIFREGHSTRLILLAMENVTERRLLEKVMAESELKFRAVAETATDAIVSFDANETITYFNHAAELSFGYSAPQVMGKSIRLLIPAGLEPHRKLASCLATKKNCKAGKTAEVIGKRRNGSEFPLEISLSQWKIEEALFLTAIMRNITERKHLYNILSQSRNELSEYVDNMSTFNAKLDLKGNFLLANRAAQAALGLSLETGVKANFLDGAWWKYDSKVRARVSEAFKKAAAGTTVHYTEGLRLANGQMISISFSLVPVLEKTKNIKYLLFEGRDITTQKLAEQALQKIRDQLELRVQERTSDLTQTNELLVSEIAERKRAEEQIKISLKEKELLLKEIQHRVKNNLQVISSLINLQSHAIDNQQVQEQFNESENRIKSMALVYEQLHHSKDVSWVNFAKYIRQLATNLFRSYAINPEDVALNIEADETVLAVDAAIPCGLIINELISNALKYAFPKGKKGEIQLSFQSNSKEGFVLCIRDSGVGLPKDFEIENTKTLGLQLVKTLTDQLGGSMKIFPDRGTVVQITFEAPKYDISGSPWKS